MSVEQSVQQLQIAAMGHLQAGRLTEADAACRELLSRTPDDGNALQMLGIISHQMGHVDAAIGFLQRAVAINPQAAGHQINLGSVLASAGRVSEALDAFAKAVRLRPDLPEGQYNLSKALFESGQIDQAKEAAHKAIALRGNYAEARNLLGLVLQSQKQYADAENAYRQAIAIKPGFSEAINNLVSVLLAQARAAEAVELLKNVLASRPDFPEAWTNLGSALHALGRFDDAVAAYLRAIAIRPGAADSHVNLGMTLLELGRVSEAIATGEQAVRLAPINAEAWYHLANALRHAGRLDDAEAAYRRCIAIRPTHADAIANLGNTLRDCGRLDESIEWCGKATTLTSESWPAEAVIYSLHFHPGYDGRQILAEHRKWNETYARPLIRPAISHVNNRDPHRKLRIGYVSPDFRTHCQSNFTIPLLSHHDRVNFEVVCYSSVSMPDALTARIRNQTDAWRDIPTLNDEQAAEMITRDRIDILVDLTMHMDKSRLLAFARKPAPIQVTWLAYPGTTGLATMDYRLSDPHLDPPGKHDDFYSEKTVRLPDTFWCYDPLTHEIPINDLPASANGFITFGCLNNFCKITGVTLDLWAKALIAIPKSRLIVLTPGGSTRQRFVAALQSRGIDGARIEAIDRLPREAYLAAYNRFDLCLDTFPYNGHTTTLDSLWMGVPPITMSGETAVSRGGLSLLSNVGLADFIASSPAEFVDVTKRAVTDLPRLATIRGTLRQRMQRSALMDGSRFAKNVEAAFRQMWVDWCSTVGKAGSSL